MVRDPSFQRLLCAACAVLASLAGACQDEQPQEVRPPVARVSPQPPPARPRFATADAYLDAIAHARNDARFDVRRKDDDAYQQEYESSARRAHLETIDLIGEFCALFPDHGHVPVLLSERWKTMCTQLDMLDEATAEMETLLAQEGLSDSVEWTLRNNLFWAHLGSLDGDLQAGRERDPQRLIQASAALGAFLKRYPNDPDGPLYLYRLAHMYDGDDERVREIYSKLVALFPESNFSQPAAGWLRRASSLGKPFDLFFEDAISGQQIDVAQYRGKVVLVSFWATWNPVCLTELEDHKQLLEQYAGRLAILGVSHDYEDKGGKEALAAVVAGQGIAWPQYYQGSKWRGELSTVWGVNKIPTIFVVDAAGNLHSTDAHGRLTEAIEAALAEGQ